jgi:arsenate reductase
MAGGDLPRGELARRAAAELVGTGLLVAVVVGSGIAAQNLSTDPGLRLLENALATAGGLAVLILVLGPVSGAHFNPVVSLADWWLGRGAGSGLTGRQLGVYLPAQCAGGVCGAVLANALYAEPLVSWSQHRRGGGNLLLSEVVATAGLVVLIFALAGTGKFGAVPWAVGSYIGAAYWWSPSTSFANPAVTIGRAFSNTLAGIAPASVPGFVGGQLVGLAVGVVGVLAFFPGSSRAADDVVVPHAEPEPAGSTHG